MQQDRTIVRVISKESSPRLHYVVNHIFNRFKDTSVVISSDADNLDDGDILIYYGHASTNSHDIALFNAGLLFETMIQPQQIQLEQKNGLSYFFASPRDYDALPFDLFSMVFYLLSRYEECGSNVKRDQHNRYVGSQSLAAQGDFLEVAVVDRWIIILMKIINQKYKLRLQLKSNYRELPSLDIDLPYAYKYKGSRAVLGMLRDIVSGNMGSVVDRFIYWLKGKDPFDTYDYLKVFFQRNGKKPRFFILNRLLKPHDENHIAQTDRLKSIVQKIASFAEIGIHPSYTSNTDLESLRQELKSLTEMTDVSQMSRQHFLKLTFPQTYRKLLHHGIREDHSMIYPDVLGFRASTSYTFLWYDLEQEETTELRIYPYVVMDVTLRYYMHLSPDDAINRISRLRQEVIDNNGCFGWIWHNSSLNRAYGWAPWKRVFEDLMLH